MVLQKRSHTMRLLNLGLRLEVVTRNKVRNIVIIVILLLVILTLLLLHALVALG